MGKLRLYRLWIRLRRTPCDAYEHNERCSGRGYTAFVVYSPCGDRDMRPDGTIRLCDAHTARMVDGKHVDFYHIDDGSTVQFG